MLRSARRFFAGVVVPLAVACSQTDGTPVSETARAGSEESDDDTTEPTDGETGSSETEPTETELSETEGSEEESSDAETDVDPESSDAATDVDPESSDAATDAELESSDVETEPIETDEPEDCFDTPSGAEPHPQPEGELEVELGARDGGSGVDFVPFDDSCGIPIGGVGQSGLTARFALRVRGESLVDRAYVVITLLNFNDPERDPAPNNGPGVVRALDCREDGWCYLVPLLVEISHLARLPELEGTEVTFSLEVTSSEDEAVYGTLYGWGAFVLEEEVVEE